jgi:acyl-CoA hydrolase
MEQMTVANSKTQLAQIMLPEHANAAGNVHGGNIMKMIDNAAGIAAQRHTRSNCVTASVDRIDFISPVFIGNLVTVMASVNYVEKTSMEIGVRIHAECMNTGNKTHVGSAYLTFVSLDASDKPQRVPNLMLESEDDIRRNAEAKERRDVRLKNRKPHKHAQELCLTRPENFRHNIAAL